MMPTDTEGLKSSLVIQKAADREKLKSSFVIYEAHRYRGAKIIIRYT